MEEQKINCTRPCRIKHIHLRHLHWWVPCRCRLPCRLACRTNPSRQRLCIPVSQSICHTSVRLRPNRRVLTQSLCTIQRLRADTWQREQVWMGVGRSWQRQSIMLRSSDSLLTPAPPLVYLPPGLKPPPAQACRAQRSTCGGVGKPKPQQKPGTCRALLLPHTSTHPSTHPPSTTQPGPRTNQPSLQRLEWEGGGQIQDRLVLQARAAKGLGCREPHTRRSWGPQRPAPRLTIPNSPFQRKQTTPGVGLSGAAGRIMLV